MIGYCGLQMKNEEEEENESLQSVSQKVGCMDPLPFQVKVVKMKRENGGFWSDL